MICMRAPVSSFFPGNHRTSNGKVLPQFYNHWKRNFGLGITRRDFWSPICNLGCDSPKRISQQKNLSSGALSTDPVRLPPLRSPVPGPMGTHFHSMSLRCFPPALASFHSLSTDWFAGLFHKLGVQGQYIEADHFLN